MSGSVGPVSGQCRLTQVSEVSGSVGAGVGLVSGLLDSGRARLVSRSVGVSGCRGVGVSGSVGECQGVSRCRGVGVSTMSMSVLCYASAVLVALLHITLLGKHPLPTSPACNTLACQLCILHSLPPLQAAWILAIGVACRFVLQRRRCLGASIAAMLTSLLATPLLVSFAFFIPCHLCRQPGLWGLVLLAGLRCSVGIIWVPALLPCWHHCLPHPLLVSLINVCSSFLATFASNVNCGEWRCLPVCIAASALFGLASIVARLASWLKHSLC